MLLTDVHSVVVGDAIRRDPIKYDDVTLGYVTRLFNDEF